MLIIITNQMMLIKQTEGYMMRKENRFLHSYFIITVHIILLIVGAFCADIFSN